MPDEVLIRPASSGDWPSIEGLLKDCALPDDGAREHLSSFLVAEVASQVVATAGLEVYGPEALLRSVAVRPSMQGTGLGRKLVDAAQALARSRAVTRLHLLTTTADQYFARRGFVVQERATVPSVLRSSEELRGACPASATYMTCRLGPLIRAATPDDAAAFEAIYRPIVLETAISFEWEPPTVDDFGKRVEKVTAKYPWLVALDGNSDVAGFVYANSHRDAPSYQWSVNTSVFIRQDMRGQGVGKALYSQLFAELVNLGYFHAFAGVALPNLESVGLHEACGFRRLGVYEKVGFKFGQWRDVAWFRKQLQAAVPNPGPPRPFLVAPN